MDMPPARAVIAGPNIEFLRLFFEGVNIAPRPLSALPRQFYIAGYIRTSSSPGGDLMITALSGSVSLMFIVAW
jgi:hypothetical protein